MIAWGKWLEEDENIVYYRASLKENNLLDEMKISGHMVPRENIYYFVESYAENGSPPPYTFNDPFEVAMARCMHDLTESCEECGKRHRTLEGAVNATIKTMIAEGYLKKHFMGDDYWSFHPVDGVCAARDLSWIPQYVATKDTAKIYILKAKEIIDQEIFSMDDGDFIVPDTTNYIELTGNEIVDFLQRYNEKYNEDVKLFT